MGTLLLIAGKVLATVMIGILIACTIVTLIVTIPFQIVNFLTEED